MNLLNIQIHKSFAVMFILGLALCGSVYADNNHKVGYRIGLKSTAVLRNDLRQMGLTVNKITLAGTNASIRVLVRGKIANLQVNRLTGTVRIVKATPKVRQFIIKRVPKIQMDKPRTLVRPIRRIRSDIRVKPRPIRRDIRVRPQPIR